MSHKNQDRKSQGGRDERNNRREYEQQHGGGWQGGDQRSREHSHGSESAGNQGASWDTGRSMGNGRFDRDDRGGQHESGNGRNFGNGRSQFEGRSEDGGHASSMGPHVGKGPKGYQRSDDRIREEVSDELMAHGDIDASEIEVDVKGGEVILKGTVDSREAKRMAEDVAERIQGVRDVTNQIRVSKSGSESGQSSGGARTAGKNSNEPSQPSR